MDTDTLASAISRAIDAEQAQMARFEREPSKYAYHAGRRDAYVKVLATLGAEYLPLGWMTPEPDAKVAPIPSRVSTVRVHATRADLSAAMAARRSTIVEDESEPQTATEIMAAIVEGVAS